MSSCSGQCRIWAEYEDFYLGFHLVGTVVINQRAAYLAFAAPSWVAFKKSTRPCELIQREAWRVCWRQGPDRLPEVGGSGEAAARAAHPFVGLVVAGQAQEEPSFHGGGLCRGRRPMREAAPDGHPRTPAGLCAENRDGRGIRRARG